MIRVVNRIHVVVLFIASLLAGPALAATALPDFVTLAKDNSPAVVNISTTQIEATGAAQSGKHTLPLPELFKRFLQQEGAAPKDFDVRSLGSGFIISSDGYILTNRHVVEHADRILVRLSDRRTFRAKVIGSDKATDVALIKIDAHDLPTVKIGDSKDLQVGEWVLAIGSPFGFDHSVTAGIVSAKGRSLPTENYIPFIQTDVAINPGNSGGPLINLKGQVVGMNSQIYSRTGGFMGLSFSIPINLAMDVAQQLRKHGHVSRGYLGILIQDVSYELAESFGLKQPRGALVSEVLPKSPAARAGLQAGDIIVAFNGVRIQRSAALPPLVGSAPVGSSAQLQVIRQGKTLTLSVKIAQLPKDAAKTANKRRPAGDQPTAVSRAGLSIVDMTAKARQESGLMQGGALVARVGSGPARVAGFEQGDVIKSFAGHAVRNAADLGRLMDRVAQGATVPVLVVRHGEPVFLPLRPHD